MSQIGYVVGDLHLGAGVADGLEDFFPEDDEAFDDFCGRIASPSTVLFLNGDIIDFAQIPPFETPTAPQLLWTQAASLAKLELALAAHGRFFDGLRRVLAAGGRVQYLVGNHDLDIAWPAVQQRLRAHLDHAAADRLTFVTGTASFHGVHVEHGYAFTPENSPLQSFDFIHEHDGVHYLEKVWGTDFMLQFYNDLERQHPFADNVKPMISVVWHGLKNRWIGGREVFRLLVFLKRRGLPWAGIASAVLDEGSIGGDRDRDLVAGRVVASFDDEQWQQVLAERIAADPTFVDELAAEARRAAPEERAVAFSTGTAQVPAPVTGASTLGIFRDERELRAAKDRLAAPGITSVVFGHTHQAVDGALGGCLFNYGTWLPSLDLASPHVAAKIRRDGLTLEMLSDRALYKVERLAVRIQEVPGHAAHVELVDVATIDG